LKIFTSSLAKTTKMLWKPWDKHKYKQHDALKTQWKQS